MRCTRRDYFCIVQNNWNSTEKREIFLFPAMPFQDVKRADSLFTFPLYYGIMKGNRKKNRA